jgi:hypothetical protein
MNDDELKRLESLEKLVHRQTSKILEMQDTIKTLRTKIVTLKGRNTKPSPDPLLVSPAPPE